MKNKVLICLLLSLLFILILTSCCKKLSYDYNNSDTWWYEGHTDVNNNNNKSNNNYNKFQDRMSIDWDSEQEMLLIYNSVYQTGQNGTAEDYAYNIIVALNRMLSDEYPNTIEEVCETNYIFATVPDEAFDGMDLVKYNKWDKTNGSLEYEHQ